MVFAFISPFFPADADMTSSSGHRRNLVRRVKDGALSWASRRAGISRKISPKRCSCCMKICARRAPEELPPLSNAFKMMAARKAERRGSAARFS
jgi:hypothetical protein